jgi:hypothetical protein
VGRGAAPDDILQLVAAMCEPDAAKRLGDRDEIIEDLKLLDG